MLYTYLANINYGELNFPSLEYSDVSYPFFFISQFSGAYFIFLSFFFFQKSFLFFSIYLMVVFLQGQASKLGSEHGSDDDLPIAVFRKKHKRRRKNALAIMYTL